MIMFATDSKILIERTTLNAAGELEFMRIQEYSVGSRATSLSWSPVSESKVVNGVHQCRIWYKLPYTVY
jgi:hypothetical protein